MNLANSDPTASGFGLEVKPEFLRSVGIVTFADTFRKFPFVILNKAHVPGTADINTDLVGWRHVTRLVPYFQGSHEKSVFDDGDRDVLFSFLQFGPSDCILLRVHG